MQETAVIQIKNRNKHIKDLCGKTLAGSIIFHFNLELNTIILVDLSG